MGTRDRVFMETNPGIPPEMRRWAKDVNDAIETGSGPGWATTTTTTTTTSTTTTTTSTSTTTTTTE